ncbi:acetate/propionate family kinase [Candidatus Woesearchaeota archaeon]|nr:acetate/propionate family kinase [Candidatus Woesearchaeota archaeon]
MNVLVLNSGSSSLKFQIIDTKKEQVFLKGHVDGIGLNSCKIIINNKEHSKKIKNHAQAISFIFSKIDMSLVHAVGHRVVHGGEYYTSATKITASVLKRINQLSSLAPLHNPSNLAGIIAVKKLFPKLPQVAVFDTAFHQTIPPEAFMYGIPYDYYKKYKIRKYGFHGTSHKYIVAQTKKLLNKRTINMVSCHIGNGSSITAIKNNISIDTSMGFTPLPGIIMGTRSGDIDPEIIGFLEEKEHLSTAEVKSILNKKSGLLGVAGSSDMRVLHDRAINGDKRAKLAIAILAYDIAKYIGAYAGIIGRLDAIVFTAGLGENAYYLREKVMNYFIARNIVLDNVANKKNNVVISSSSSIAKVLVIPTNEELMIAKETAVLLK